VNEHADQQMKARDLSERHKRKFLLIQNTGINPVTIKEDSAPVAAAGMGLDPATSAGGQGGSWNPTEVVPTNSYWAISTVGTTVISVEG